MNSTMLFTTIRMPSPARELESQPTSRNEITKTPTSEVWEMENKKGRIGNDRGLSLMEKLVEQLERMPRLDKQLAERMSRLEKQLAEQEELAEIRNRPHWQVRVAELERLVTTHPMLEPALIEMRCPQRL